MRRIYLHARGGIRGRSVILTLHVRLAGDVRRRRQGRLTTGRRVCAVHAVAVDLTRIAVRYQGPLHLCREAAHLKSTCVISSFVRYKYRYYISLILLINFVFFNYLNYHAVVKDNKNHRRDYLTLTIKKFQFFDFYFS